MQKKLAAMEFLKFLAERVYRAFRRVFPRCGMISQAIAFNLFLAFFPALLIAVALATSPVGGRTSLLELIRQITGFLPPGSQQIVSEYLTKRGPEVWKWALAGLTGTLLAGSQVMKLVMQGIQVIYGEEDRMGWLPRQVRGLVLILVTIAPLLAAGQSSRGAEPARELAGAATPCGPLPRRLPESPASPTSLPAIPQGACLSTPPAPTSRPPARASSSTRKRFAGFPVEENR